MSSKFLNNQDSGLSSLSSGTFDANLKSLAIQDLVPGLPVKCSSTKTLYSALIQPSEINGSFGDVTAPATHTANAIPRWNGTSGGILKDSGIIISDTNYMDMPIDADITLSGTGRVNAPSINTPAIDSDGALALKSGSAVGIYIADAPSGAITLSGTNYTGQAGEFLQVDVNGTLTAQPAVIGPITATNNAIARFDTNGNTIKNSGVLIYDTTNDIGGVGNLSFAGASIIYSPETLKYDASDHDFTGGSVSITESLSVGGALTMSSITKPFTPPKMTTNQRDAILAPTEGNVVFDTLVNRLSVYDGTNWGYSTPSTATPVTVPNGAMTSNSTVLSSGTWIASASTGAFAAYLVFNDTNDGWYSDVKYVGGMPTVAPIITTSVVGLGNVQGEWVQLQAPVAKTIAYYMIKSHQTFLNTAPTNWVFCGSNDAGATWTVIDTRTNITGWVLSQDKSFDVAVPTAYSYFRIIATQVWGDIRFGLGEWQLFEAPKFNIAITGDLTSNKAYGSFGITSTSTTSATGSYSAVLYSTTVAGTLSNFTHASPAGTLTYTGILTKTFRICCSFSAFPDAAAASNLYFGIGKNSSTSAIPVSGVRIYTASTNAHQCSLSTIVSLVTNDVVRLIVLTSPSMSFSVSNMTFTIVEV